MIQNNLRQATLCFLVKEDQDKIIELLLAMKKRGFGAGRWNGVGGKFDDERDRDISATARRETKEEINVDIVDLRKVAILNFYFPDIPKEKNYDQQVHVFTSKEWQSEPQESEEMAPKWFKVEDIPYRFMWADDEFWLPHVLGGKKVLADFIFQGEGEQLRERDVKIVHEL